MADLSERVTALEVAQKYEAKARDEDHDIMMSHSRRIHLVETSIHGILVDGSRRDRRLGQLEVVADEAKIYRDRILFAKASGKYLVAAVIIGLYLSGKLSGEQLEAIRGLFMAS